MLLTLILVVGISVIVLASVLTKDVLGSSSLDVSKFRDFAEGIQNVSVSVALIVGGIWTIYVFSTTLQQQNALREEVLKLAETSLKAAQMDELHRKLQALPLELTISAEPTREPHAGKYGVIVRVTAANPSTRFVTFALKEKVLTIARVRDGVDARYLSASWSVYPRCFVDLGSKSQDSEQLLDIVVEPGSTKHLTYYAELPEAGVYLVSFHPPVSEQRQTMPLLIKNDSAPHEWIAQTFVEIQTPARKG